MTVYLLSVYTYDNQLIYRVDSVHKALEQIEFLSSRYVILGFDLRKVSNHNIRINGVEKHHE